MVPGIAISRHKIITYFQLLFYTFTFYNLVNDLTSLQSTQANTSWPKHKIENLIEDFCGERWEPDNNNWPKIFCYNTADGQKTETIRKPDIEEQIVI